MKRLIFLISFLFTVACYASPPPLLIDLDSGPVLTSVFQSDYTQFNGFEMAAVQEVTFIIIGNVDQLPVPASIDEYAEEFRPVKLPGVAVMKCTQMISYKPPLLMTHDSAGFTVIHLQARIVDRFQVVTA